MCVCEGVHIHACGGRGAYIVPVHVCAVNVYNKQTWECVCMYVCVYVRVCVCTYINIPNPHRMTINQPYYCRYLPHSRHPHYTLQWLHKVDSMSGNSCFTSEPIENTIHEVIPLSTHAQHMPLGR